MVKFNYCKGSFESDTYKEKMALKEKEDAKNKKKFRVTGKDGKVKEVEID